MKTIYYVSAIIICMFLTQSCQNYETDATSNIDSISNSTTRAAAEQETYNEDGSQYFWLYSDPITVTWDEYFLILELLVNPGLSITNCDAVFASYNENNLWSDNFESSIKVTASNSDYITFHLEDYFIYRYKCNDSNNPICDYVDSNLRVTKGSNISNCILGSFIFENIWDQYIKINFSSYLDITTCQAADCTGHNGSGGGAE